MLKFKLYSNRYAVITSFIICFLSVSQIIRIIFFIWQYDEVSWNILHIIKTFTTGLFFDIGTVAFISVPAVLYYSLVPNSLGGTLLDRILVYLFTSLTVFIITLTFFAELTFWDEFKTRFNFIAVDYLIYTHEVIANINESYPIPLLITGISLLTIVFIFTLDKRKTFNKTFTSKTNFKARMYPIISIAAICLFFAFHIDNCQAEWSNNRYNSEISKSGIYSFFAAFRNNQMKYTLFYSSIDNQKALNIVKSKLNCRDSKYTSVKYPLHRTITDSMPSIENKNVIFILVESLSASFLKEFGNKENITPFMDSIVQKSIFFENIYATGTRTVRGMEALTLCIPPTPGQSIVKRPENQNLYTVSNVFKSRNYQCNFFYGGDGYFDNMNSYFGGNGFTIYDRGRGSVLSDRIKTIRHNINDNEVTFENAWGICDEDIFNKMIKSADYHYLNKELFFNFVMTTSNHRPFTYPSGKIDIQSGSGREGAVKYTDFALKSLFQKASRKPWFKNTVFVIAADHCASSAGKDEIDIKNYHIPAFIVNLPQKYNQKIKKQCSQIDLWPTLFGIFHWNYESDFYGKNVLDSEFEERTFVGTYRKLALMKKEKIMILSDQKKQAFYLWKKNDNSLKSIPIDQHFLQETISWYQTADYLFTNKLLK